MAILTHTLNGAASKEVAENGTYREYGSTATGDNGDIVYSNDWDQANTATPGTYTITYSAIDDTAVANTAVTREIVVVANVGNIDTTFDLGDVSRTGSETTGTKYDDLVDAARTGTAPSQVSSAYFSGLALDPYEVANSK